MAGGRPARVVIDSREVREGDLFVGLPGERFDGGEFGAAALRQGAWGILVATQWGRELAMQRNVGAGDGSSGWVLGAAEPLGSLQSLARAWREELGCRVVGITGSTGKTTVKDICRALLPGQVEASPENYNTEIGLPLASLAAPEGTDVLVLEMGMRGPGQIAELCAIARARRGRDHQRRAGTHRAARLDRGDRRDQGGDHRRAPARAGPPSFRPRPGRSSRISGERRGCSASAPAETWKPSR